MYIVTRLPAFVIDTTSELKVLIPRVNGLYVDPNNIKISDHPSSTYVTVFS